MEQLAFVLTIMAVSVIFMVSAYRRGYKHGANTILNEWKNWLNDVEDDDNDY